MTKHVWTVDYFNNKWQLKPLVYLAVAFGIWASTVYLMSVNRDGMLSRIENIRPYKLKKLFEKYEDVWNEAKKKVNDRWTTGPDDACFALTSVAADANCLAKRSGIVTDLRATFKCGVAEYRSPFCSCLHKVLDVITPDNRLGTATPSVPTATFLTAVKNANLKGGKDEFLKSVESCHYLHHTTTVADQPDNPWARHSIILFILSTVVTLAILDFYVLIAFNAYIRLFVILAFLFFIVFLPSVVIPNNSSTYATNVGFFVLLPTIVIFVWVELMMTDQDKAHFPYLHPGYFPIIHAMLTIYALSQNGVLDEDLLRTEIFKSHTLSYLYLCLCFYSSMDGVKSLDDTKSIQDSTFWTTVATLLIAGSSGLVPYAQEAQYNVLWYLPLAFVVSTVVGVLWVDTKDRLGGSNDTYRKEPITLGTLYQSTALLVIVAFAVWYGVSDYWKVERLFVERYYTTSIQYNTTYQPWQNPVFTAAAY